MLSRDDYPRQPMKIKAENHIGIQSTISTANGFIQPAEPAKLIVKCHQFRIFTSTL